jgi:hypothetical protein
MNTAVEVTVKISNDEQRYSQKFLTYESVLISSEDPRLKEMVASARENFKGVADDIVVKISYVWS